MKPFFSIIIPCCDVEPYVRDCLDSVLNQPFADWECIIGVETSKDRTEEVVREYAAKDSRFRVFTGQRSGSCSVSRNIGTDLAQGEYVIFLDGDDVITEGSLGRIHEKISAQPGADLYPCAIQVRNEITGKSEALRDNYPKSVSRLTGAEATVLLGRLWHHPCPMLQMTVFSRRFLVSNDLKCIPGLRCQDSEFSPRALYLANCVIPIHEPFYIYRIHPASVQTLARGADYFYKDYAIIFKSLLAFHASVSGAPGFDRRVSASWAHTWLTIVFLRWFHPTAVKLISRERRLETLNMLFADGFGDFNALLKSASSRRRLAGWWARAFMTKPAMRWAAEKFFAMYFLLSR